MKTTLTLTKNSDGSIQTILVGDNGKLLDRGRQRQLQVEDRPAAPAGMFTPAHRRTCRSTPTSWQNFKVNGRRINVTVTNNDGEPVPTFPSVRPSRRHRTGAIITDDNGKGYVEATTGSYTLTPSDPHPGLGYHFDSAVGDP